jgi:pantothenate synthetase
LLVEEVRLDLRRKSEFCLEYAELRDAVDLSVVENSEKPAVLALAARVGKTRLIDIRCSGR